VLILIGKVEMRIFSLYKQAISFSEKKYIREEEKGKTFGMFSTVSQTASKVVPTATQI
jgi:hypothetical protein